MCESRAQFRSTRLWTLNNWVDSQRAIMVCHKAVFERSLSPECIKLHSAKKTAIRQKSILISGPCHARVITAKTFLQMCCTGCPECHAHGLRVCSEITTLLQLTAFHQNKDRERTRKTGDHFAGWDFSVDTRVQRSIYCGFRPKEVDHAWFPMNSVEFIQA